MSFHVRSSIPEGHSADTLLNYWAHRACETHVCIRPVHHLGESEMEDTPAIKATYVQSTQKSYDYHSYGYQKELQQ